MHEAPLPPDWRSLQRILNERWPLRDKHGEGCAKGIPIQQASITVDARVIWERDGEEIISGRAMRWIDAYVFVTFHDQRRLGHGVWLRASDVSRR